MKIILIKVVKQKITQPIGWAIKDQEN